MVKSLPKNFVENFGGNFVETAADLVRFHCRGSSGEALYIAKLNPLRLLAPTPKSDGRRGL